MPCVCRGPVRTPCVCRAYASLGGIERSQHGKDKAVGVAADEPLHRLTLRDKAVEVEVRRRLELEGRLGDVVEGLVVEGEGHVAVLEEGVGRED